MIVVIKKPGEPAGAFKVDGRRRSHVLDEIIDGTPVQCLRFRDESRGINLDRAFGGRAARGDRPARVAHRGRTRAVTTIAIILAAIAIGMQLPIKERK